MANAEHADFFCFMCDHFPRNTSIPLPFSCPAQDILDLHQTVVFQGQDSVVQFSCVFPWTREPAQKIFEAYLAQLHAEQPGPQHTRKSANNVAMKRSRKKENIVAAQAYLARQTLVALRDLFPLGAVHGHSHADVNLACAGLEELKLAAQDILLHRSD